MKKISFLLVILFVVLIFTSCQKPWSPLFNGENLDNWDKHLGTFLTGAENAGIGATPENVFTVVEKDGEKLIRISGVVNGSLATRDTFSNYHLQLVFKWGDSIYTKQNSGLLYHSFGDFGEALGTWMVNAECQLMHERLGDTYLMKNMYCETAVKTVEDGFIFSKNDSIKPFGVDFERQGIKKALDAEKPLGEWNTVDLYCFGRTSVHVVNGQVVMINTNIGKTENGQIIPVSSGKIQLQSEGAELFVKTIQVKPIKEIPKELLQ